MIEKPKFKLYFLHPKFWLTWLGVLFLYLVSWFPYRLQLLLGKGLGRLFKKAMPRRVNIARRNLELCFPDYSAEKIEQLVTKNLENTGIAYFEIGIAWWWPNWRIKRKLHVHGRENLDNAQKDGKGVLMLLFHFLSLEVHARLHGLVKPAVGLYRPHNNAVMEFLQTRGRGRSNKYMIQRRDVKGMLNAIKQGEIAGYLPDQDYGRRRVEFVPFFNVADASTTTGTTLFAQHPNCNVLVSRCVRRDDGSGYDVYYEPALTGYPSGDDKADAAYINSLVEEAVLKAPTQYLWVHRRFKTRPEKDMPSYYD
ncbi:LpxL/LpxP family Kdo(2)-lipid IV(A) lauroyl/palmitoleoyl acyltransferase [Idiomarina seosinensis]|uniref:Lipid A biosynthesis acyltransferase n=1 Tax=Idiomarina seosinensis TaxID=281739 RepID=A0A432Z4G3_9GAMM|nr:LpxL/LpxP family Kdo(2)-lipid IV(A) lauroyl/palmitoleoyl acyltransferase [Idiomarina seosinensis]RUO72784.1 lipid A biosynthesis lauroyl acyltransferase [Idiomarina seosinensis]